MKEVDKDLLNELSELTHSDYSKCDINDLIDDVIATIKLKNKKILEYENQPLETYNPGDEYGY